MNKINNIEIKSDLLYFLLFAIIWTLAVPLPPVPPIKKMEFLPGTKRWEIVVVKVGEWVAFIWFWMYVVVFFDLF